MSARIGRPKLLIVKDKTANVMTRYQSAQAWFNVVIAANTDHDQRSAFGKFGQSAKHQSTVLITLVANPLTYHQDIRLLFQPVFTQKGIHDTVVRQSEARVDAAVRHVGTTCRDERIQS